MTARRLLNWYLGSHLTVAVFLLMRCLSEGGRVRLEWKGADAWTGLYWKREPGTVYAEGTLHVYQIVLFCLPLHWEFPGRLYRRSPLQVHIRADSRAAREALDSLSAHLEEWGLEADMGAGWDTLFG